MSGIYFFIFASCELLTEWLTNVHQDGIEEGPIPPTLLKLRENERKNWDQKDCNMIYNNINIQQSSLLLWGRYSKIFLVGMCCAGFQK